jgi:hypothetical protein
VIIVLRQRSQLSNRLVALAALMGFCLEHRIRLVVFSLSDYRELFAADGSSQGIRIVMLPRPLYGIGIRILSTPWIRKLVERLPSIRYFNGRRTWVDVEVASLKQGLWIIDGHGDWCSLMPKISDEAAVTIRQMLRYQPEWRSQALECHAELSNSCDLLIGVHARRGDYASHRGGRWFYTEEEYLHWIEQAKARLRSATQQRVHVVVCSNEPGFLQNKSRPDLHLSKLRTACGDQLLLSMCDVIIGPPSTFSVWAAFLRDTPLLHIFNREQQLSRTQIRRSTLFYGWKPEVEAEG